MPISATVVRNRTAGLSTHLSPSDNTSTRRGRRARNGDNYNVREEVELKPMGPQTTNLSNPSSARDTFSKDAVLLDDYIQVALNGVRGRQKKNRMLRGLVFYTLFMITLLLILFMQRNIKSSFQMNAALQDRLVDEEFPQEFSHILKNFEAIFAEEEYWQWFYGVFSEAVNECTYNSTVPGVLMGKNRVIGKMRLRQVRVKSSSCDVSSVYEKYLQGACYGFYSNSKKDKSSFGANDRFTFSGEDETQAISLWGRIETSYDADGFVVDLPHPSEGNVTAVIEGIQQDGWIDVQTRAVILTMNLYNQHVNHYNTMHFLFEFSPGGGVFPYVHFKTFKLDLYVTAWDTFRAVLEVLFIGILFYFMYSEYDDCKALYDRSVGLKSLLPYFLSGWNVLDIANIILFWAVIVMQIIYIAHPDRLSFDLSNDHYIPMEKLALLYTNIFNVMSFNLLLSFIKFFKYVQFNGRMVLLWSTLGKAAGDLFTFLIFFLIVLLGFASMGYLLFGPELMDYRDISSALSTVLQMSLGDFVYDDLQSVNRVLAPIYTALFILLVFFVMVNIFLAIINHSYDIVHEEVKKQESSLLDPVIKENLSRLIDRLRRHDRTLSNRELLRHLEMLKEENSKKEEKIKLENGVKGLDQAVDHICVPSGDLDNDKERRRMKQLIEAELQVRRPKDEIAHERQDLRILKLKAIIMEELINMEFEDPFASLGKCDSNDTLPAVGLSALQSKIRVVEEKMDLILSELQTQNSYGVRARTSIEN
eukprot:GCRY01001237.1.p1 GENE.GCRY01001237.1~~GCRY01001237.1.p1  ORF type:complete len:759 (+),score=205.88 GCRY01001237.1:259-2535(+)